jgi:serine/threonine protein kinase
MSDASSTPPSPTAPPPPEDPTLVNSLRAWGAGRVVFARFRLIRELGVGGMAVVWLAADERLGLEVALKFLPGMVATDPEALHDLRQEITRGLRLTHPGIVRLFDLHEDPTEGMAAIAMEYIDGPTLADEKARRPERCFDVAEPLTTWVRSLCDVLAYVHEEARVVHRDLKPRNVMLTSSGRLKVADFGIAATLCDSHSRVTKHPGSSGTPVYMSPQQALGRHPVEADDIYSLGATIYELLTSKPPFFRGNMAVILHQVATQVPPGMAERRKELGLPAGSTLPPGWEETIAACLSKEPEARPQTAREVAGRLGLAEKRATMEPMPRGKPPRLRKGPLRRVILLASLTCLAAGITALWFASPVLKRQRKAASPEVVAANGDPMPVALPAEPASPDARTERAYTAAPLVSRFRSAKNVFDEVRKPEADKDSLLRQLAAALDLSTALSPPLPETTDLFGTFLQTLEALAADPSGTRPSASNAPSLHAISGYPIGRVLRLSELAIEERRKLIPVLQKLAGSLAFKEKLGFASDILPGLNAIDAGAANELRDDAIAAFAAASAHSSLDLYRLKDLGAGKPQDLEPSLHKLIEKARLTSDPKKRFGILKDIPQKYYLFSSAATLSIIRPSRRLRAFRAQ